MRNTCLLLNLVLSLIGTSLGGERDKENQRVVTRKQTEVAAFKSASFGRSWHFVPRETNRSLAANRNHEETNVTDWACYLSAICAGGGSAQEVEEEGCGLSQASRGLAL